MSYINKHANDFDLLIFSDFNYGILPQKLVERIIEVCQKNEIIMEIGNLDNIPLEAVVTIANDLKQKIAFLPAPKQFSRGGGESMAKQYEVELLGSLPLDVKIREGVDNGKPTVAIEPNSVISDNYRDIARSVAAKISLQAKDYTSRFPKIVIENN